MTQREFERQLAIEEGKSIFATLNAAFPNSCRAAYLSNPILGYSDKFTLYFHIKNISKRNMEKAEKFCGLLEHLSDDSRVSEFGLEELRFIKTKYFKYLNFEERVISGDTIRIM